MLKTWVPAIAAALLITVAHPAPATAAPALAAPIAAPDGGVLSVRHYWRGYGRWRRHRMHRRAMYRRRMGRRAAPSQAGNARNPNAPVPQQQQGGTSGGPRY